jgi:uncharacterized protein (DUF2147 family)
LICDEHFGRGASVLGALGMHSSVQSATSASDAWAAKKHVGNRTDKGGEHDEYNPCQSSIAGSGVPQQQDCDQPHGQSNVHNER